MKLGWIGFIVFTLTLATDPASGQASFALDNFVQGAGIDAPVYDAFGTPLEGSDYLVELWGSASSDSLAPALDVVYGDVRRITPFGTDGYFFGGGSYLSVVDVPPHGFAWLQVRAWDASLGSTYEEVEALGIGGYGESPLFYAQGNDPFAFLPELPAPLIGLESFSLRPVVPEPSTAFLLLLGGALCFWMRWRRDQITTRAKTFVFPLLVVILPSHEVASQSMFAFSNRYLVDAPVYDAEGRLLEGAGYLAELWGGVEPDSLAPAVIWDDWTSRDIEPFETDDYVGYVVGAAVVVLDAPRAGYAWLEMRAWDASLGSTYEEVQALGIGGYGESSPFYTQGSDPLALLPELPAPLTGLESFSLRPVVPEPSTAFLLLLGGALCFWMRWRRDRITTRTAQRAES